MEWITEDDPDEAETPPRHVVPERWSAWWRRHRDEVIRSCMIALVAGVAAGAAVSVATARQIEQLVDRQEQLSRERAQQAEVLENTRFVRDRVADSGGLLPFTRLNLRGADLAGLPLGCDPSAGESRCATLIDADLVDADLTGSDLSGANLFNADLTGADLSNASLIGANLIYTTLVDAALVNAHLEQAALISADLAGADLTDADLSGADLSDADLTGVCYNADTTWPVGFSAPPPSCG